MTHAFHKSVAIVMATLFVLVSCNKSEIFNVDESGEVQTIQVIGPQDVVFEPTVSTRGTEIAPSGALRFTWAVGDTLGIFPTKGNQVEFPISSSDGGSSAVFDGGGWALKTNASYSAYYPFSVWNYFKDNKTIKLDYSGQIQDGNGTFGHLSAYDFLASSLTDPVNGRVTFQMNRVGAILYIDIVVPTPSTIDSLVISCEDEIFTEAAKLDISGTDPVVNPVRITDKLTLYFKNVKTTEENETVRAYMAVLPVDFSEKIVYATLFTNNSRLGAEVVSREVEQGKAAFLRFSEAFAPALIHFADPEVKSLCVNNWDVDGDGELSYDEAAAVTDLGVVFSQNENITSFEELQYFTGLTAIASKAFYHCSSLDQVIIPENVVDIGNSAFVGCGLTRLIIPGNVYIIGDNAFEQCWNLSEITLSEGLQKIGLGSFNGCNSLTSVCIPESVYSFGPRPFSGCNSLQSIYGKFSSSDHRFLIYDGNLIAFAPVGLTEAIIPDGVTSIGDYAFYGCTGLTSIDIPDGVTSISICAFRACTGLTSIDIPGGVTTIDNWAFSLCTGLTSIIIPDSVTSIGDYAFYKCSALSSCEIPTGVTSIGQSAFSYTGLMSVVLPNSVTEVGAYAFAYCSDLTSIILSSYITVIKERTFSSCPALTSIIIPEGVTSIEKWAFQSCLGLTSVSLPDGLTSIGESAFYRCESLTTVVIPSTVTSIGSYAFLSCVGLTSVSVKALVPPSIQEGVFSSSTSYPIRVPSNKVTTYKNAENWTEYADRIKSI